MNENTLLDMLTHQVTFHISLQNGHYSEVSLGTVSPSQAAVELCLNTGVKTHVLTVRGASASPPGTNSPSLPAPLLGIKTALAVVALPR